RFPIEDINGLVPEHDCLCVEFSMNDGPWSCQKNLQPLLFQFAQLRQPGKALVKRACQFSRSTAPTGIILAIVLFKESEAIICGRILLCSMKTPNPARRLHHSGGLARRLPHADVADPHAAVQKFENQPCLAGLRVSVRAQETRPEPWIILKDSLVDLGFIPDTPAMAVAIVALARFVFNEDAVLAAIGKPTDHGFVWKRAHHLRQLPVDNLQRPIRPAAAA